ncbi:MAG: hypothetical protein FWG40_12065 [Peptococcaceae bacterium]|nr:hypothetical protein [Peptococcaceae bacterium]
MLSEETKLDFEKAIAILETMKQHTAEIEQEGLNMEVELNTLFDTWKGPTADLAHSVYDDARIKYQESVESLNELINSMLEKVKELNENDRHHRS